MKFPQLGLSQFWGPITLRADLRLIWHLKQSCSPRRELSNDMLHVTFTQGNRDDSWLLVVESQIANLTFNPSFNHNLCFKCPNESCESILDIYVLRSFQWYKKLFNPLSFDPCNHFLGIRESTWTPTPKVGVDLGMWRFIPSHTPTLLEAWDVTLGLPYTLASPCLGCKPKAKVANKEHAQNVLHFYWRIEKHWKPGCMVSCKIVQGQKRCVKTNAK